MPGSVDHAGSPQRSHLMRCDVLPSTLTTVSTSRCYLSRLNGAYVLPDRRFADILGAYVLPDRRFADILADIRARLGADEACYAFIVTDFHRLLLAGLPAHCQVFWCR